MTLSDSLAEGLAAMNLDVTEHQQIALIGFLSLLGKWNKTYNLTAIDQPERMLTHHILDSLAIIPHLKNNTLLDVGSGGGFPGIPVAIVRPDLAVTVMDASQKKCGFMQQAAIELKLPNVVVVHARVEKYSAPVLFTQIVSRAFSDLSEFVRLTTHLLAPDGYWFAMKGVHPDEEIMHLTTARVVQDIPLPIPGLNAERCLIVMEPI